MADMDKRILLLISGKRKCGKDFISSLIQKRLGTDLSTILHISEPLKKEFAELNNLDLKRLLDSTSYKEEYRAAMVTWGEEKRQNDPTYFCRKAITAQEKSKAMVWIIADVRRHSDIKYFEKFRNIKVRIVANESTRKKRGLIFTKGIDDSETETNLDDYNNWDFIIDNNDDNEEEFTKNVDELCSKLRGSVGL